MIKRQQLHVFLIKTTQQKKMLVKVKRTTSVCFYGKNVCVHGERTKNYEYIYEKTTIASIWYVFMMNNNNKCTLVYVSSKKKIMKL
jgi:hypothetical protein